MNASLCSMVLLFALVSAAAQTVAPIRILKTKIQGPQPSESAIMNTVQSRIDANKYRKVSVQLIRDSTGAPSHYLVYLFSKKYHRVDFAKMGVDKQFKVLNVQQNYRLTDADFAQQPGIDLTHAACPDNSVQFVAFAPNDIQVEQSVTIDVATAATSANLKTVKLLKDQATRDNYLNYLTCPNLRGNFYDGDSNPQLFITVDGVISADDIKTILKGKFHYLTTNIWLACEAYNNPMLSAVIDDAQTKKYAAGINNLAVGPSDNAGACAMKAAIAGKPMNASFNSCYQQYDVQSDHWGFGGNGTDDFWSAGYFCGMSFPNPIIQYDHTDVEGRVYVPVQNWSAYSNDLFAAAPDLPACGLNKNSSRTWVDIYNPDTNAKVYGFCAFGKNSDLKGIWFKPNASQRSVSIAITDRGCKKSYKSNTISWLCGASFPNPVIKYDHTDSAGRVYIPVQNWSAYSNDLFTAAPDLPACGLNKNSSRTWVDIYNADTNTKIYGFCAFSANSNLKDIWFKPGSPHGKAYVVISDRACSKSYRSNTISW